MRTPHNVANVCPRSNNASWVVERPFAAFELLDDLFEFGECLFKGEFREEGTFLGIVSSCSFSPRAIEIAAAEAKACIRRLAPRIGEADFAYCRRGFPATPLARGAGQC